MVPSSVRISKWDRRAVAGAWAGTLAAAVRPQRTARSLACGRCAGIALRITFGIRRTLPELLLIRVFGKAAKSNPMDISTLRSTLTRVLAIVLLATGFASCNEEEPTVAVIIVKDQSGAPMPGAYVKLFANPSYPLGDPTRLNKEATADGSGRAEFDYSDFYEQGQSGFAVLDIISTRDTLLGEGIIKIVEEETTEETVILLPAE